MENLGIIAGNGSLPIILAKSAASQGFNTFGIGITGLAYENLKDVCTKSTFFPAGQISKILNYLKKENIKKVVFIGKVPKLDILKNIYKLDLLALKYISKLINLNDDSFHNAVEELLNTNEITILSQTDFLKEQFQKSAILSKRAPTEEEKLDIAYGFEVAKKIASLDIGQTVIIKNKMILAIEAIEGTDEAIKRGAKLGKKNVVVVKVEKPNQDKRFDIPTIGEKSIETLGKNGGGIIAFEAYKTILVDKKKCIDLANKYNICLMGI